MMETYRGYVRTPADAIKLFEACRLGLLPRVQRRLSEKERQNITSGSVFVWDEREAGMRRWTDGKSWSASRVSGSFLTYREMEGKRGSGFGNTRRTNGRTPDSSGRLSDDDPDGEPDGYRYKADGLMKQSFSITTSQGQHLHLISYYSRPHPGAPEVPQPSTDPQLRHIIPAKGMYPESSLHEASPPALTRGPMQTYPASNPPPQAEHQGYGYTWGAPGWSGAWPPSPVGTPPWAQAKVIPEPKMYQQSQHQAKPPQQQQQQAAAPPPQLPQQLPPQLHQQPPAPPVSRPLPPVSASTQLPPIQQSAPAAVNPPPPPPPPAAAYARPPYAPEYERASAHSIASAHSSPSNRPFHMSPRAQQLQVQAAQAVMIDPRLGATSARNPQGPLPAMGPASSSMTPPRTHSASPPRRAESLSKTSLSALLHPTPSSSEPTSANPATNSANSSPRALTVGAGGNPVDHMYREDTRALRSLDRKFCI